jgi:P4 family phage/plasmid primase-like protien
MVMDNEVSLREYLDKFRVDKTIKDDVTHTLVSGGKYTIPRDQYDTLFNKLVSFHLKGHFNSLTESPRNVCSIKIDLDFKSNIDDSKRKYDYKCIENFIRLYNSVIMDYIETIDMNDLIAYVFEREKPYISKGNVKDGIHIIYPKVTCDTTIQHLIRLKVILLLNQNQMLKQFNYKNSHEDIVDKSVVSKNNWLLYGSCKPSLKPYNLTHILNSSLIDTIDEIDLKNHDCLLSIIKTCSVHLTSENDKIYKIKQDKQNEYNDYINGIVKTKVKTNKSVISTTSTMDTNEINYSKKLVKILSDDRADNHDTWIEVGWTLYNINTILLDDWIEFSQKSSKFEDGICEIKWDKFKKGTLGMGSLVRWAKIDDPDKFKDIRSEYTGSFIQNTVNCTSQGVAEYVYQLFKYEYKCTDTKSNTWYTFINHRWHKTEDGVSLRKKLTNVVMDELLKRVNDLNSKAMQYSDDEAQRNNCLARSNEFNNVVQKLRDWNFKQKIIKECSILFHDDQFEKKLDSNPNLIGFENGVYDLEVGKFRDGFPEDNIHMSTETDFIEFDNSDDVIKGVKEFLKQILPHKEVREYMLLTLSTCLIGKNLHEEFHMLTGSGGNGKSKMIELMEKAMGQYAGTLPTSLITQKRGLSGAATPELEQVKKCRFVKFQESNEDEKLNLGILKELTGGDTIYSRGMFKEASKYKPQYKLFLALNKLPDDIPPDDEGTWRRLKVVDYPSKFKYNPDPDEPFEFPRDEHLQDKLEKWKEAFMYILILNYGKFKENGKTPPPQVVEKTKEYQNDIDLYSEFISVNIIKTTSKTDFLSLNITYSRFKSWFTGNFTGKKQPQQKDIKLALEKTSRLGKIKEKDSQKGWIGFSIKPVYNYNDIDNNNINDIITETGSNYS